MMGDLHQLIDQLAALKAERDGLIRSIECGVEVIELLWKRAGTYLTGYEAMKADTALVRLRDTLKAALSSNAEKGK